MMVVNIDGGERDVVVVTNDFGDGGKEKHVLNLFFVLIMFFSVFIHSVYSSACSIGGEICRNNPCCAGFDCVTLMTRAPMAVCIRPKVLLM